MVVKNDLNVERLTETIHTAVHFLDNVIELNKYPLERIEKTSKGNRKIGLGVMGFADMLIKLGIPYDSDEAVSQAERVMSIVLREARKCIVRARQKIRNFPFTRGAFLTPRPHRLCERDHDHDCTDRDHQYHRRNIQRY
jgi:ribonucleoside-diphosphate reductase alpha chain